MFIMTSLFMGIVALSTLSDSETPTGRPGAGRVIRLEATVAAPPAAVFDLFTTREGVRRFFAPEARIDPKVGGRYEIIFAPESDPEGKTFGTAGARIRVFEPGRRLAFDWKGRPDMPDMNSMPLKTWVEIDFESIPSEPGVTHIRFAHYGFETGGTWDAAFAYFGEQAWPLVLRRLEGLFATKPEESNAKGATADGLASISGEIYLVLLHPGPAWKQGLAPGAQDGIMAHAAYMKKLFDDGRLILGGPFTDGSAGMALLKASSAGEAKGIANADPCVISGVFTPEVHGFRPVFSSLSTK